MVKIKRYVKDWLVWVIVISILFIIAIVFFYFIQTGGNFEDKKTNWGGVGKFIRSDYRINSFCWSSFYVETE